MPLAFLKAPADIRTPIFIVPTGELTPSGILPERRAWTVRCSVVCISGRPSGLKERKQGEMEK